MLSLAGKFSCFVDICVIFSFKRFWLPKQADVICNCQWGHGA
jgi:hypothetical protein